MVTYGQYSQMFCDTPTNSFNTFGREPLLFVTALLPVAPKAGCGFGYPNNLFFHPIAA
jgi:hypothetical protein